MPKSKHRHKGSGKAIRHPGRAQRPAEPQPSPEEVFLGQFHDLYVRPFMSEHPDGDAAHMIDCIADLAVDPDTLSVRPITKAAVFDIFMTPDLEASVSRPAEAAEAALAFLVEHGFALVDGEQITVPARFVPEGSGTGEVS